MHEGHNFQHAIAVHGGAGHHVKTSEKRVKEGLHRACTVALNVSNIPSSVDLEGSFLQSTVDAIKVLEDDEIFNAGHGSNLTSEGAVECDASVMTSASHFGAVGAISGVRNPVKVAAEILQHSRTPDPFGRVCPLLLVSSGAKEFARTHATCDLVEPETMVSSRATAEWEHWRHIIDEGSPNERPPTTMQDTVGALTFYKTLNGPILTSAGVSSGGILMKLPGRVGEAATFGAGCWASPRVAVSVSGTGEQIMRSSLAKALGQAVTRCFEPGSDLDVHRAINDVISREFQDTCEVMGDLETNAGAIILVNEEEDPEATPVQLRLYVVFTTESMAIGWFSRGMTKPKVKIVRQQQRVDGSGVGGSSICIEAFTIPVPNTKRSSTLPRLPRTEHPFRWMAPSIPEKIQCTTAAEFTSQLREVQGTLALPETEDNWEKISRAIQKFAALVRGGATKLDPDFVNAIKANYKPITASMLSERGRLSGVAIDFVSSFAPRLGSRFEPLVHIIIPALVKLLMRPNKVFVNRGQACLLLIIEHCHLPSIVPHLREAVKDKAQTLRLAAIEATLHVLEHFDKSLLEVREGMSLIQARHRGNVEDIESIIKDTARDANPTVRQVSRKVFEKYTEIWEERVEAFTAPFSPTIRKYLNVNGNAAGSNGSKPVAALKVKPVSEAPQTESSSAPINAGPSRPIRPKPTQQSASEGHVSNPLSRPASRVDRHGPVTSSSSGAPSGSRSDVHSRSAKYVSRNGDAAVQQHEDRVTARPASRAAVAKEYPPPTSMTSRPASRAQHFGSTKSSEQVPTAPVREPPTRPAPVHVRTASNAEQDGAPSSASSSSTFVRVQRPKPEAGPPKGPVRPAQGPVRAVSMKDPPLRPVRPQPLSVQDQEKLRPKARPLIDLRRHATPPREEPPHATPASSAVSGAPRVSDVATKVPLPESRPGSALDTESPLESNDPEPLAPSAPVPSTVSSKATSTTSNVQIAGGTKTESDGVDQVPARPESAAALSTPLISSMSSSSSSTTATKRPAVLNRRGAAPPPGQAQGFAPTRRRGGVTEPTLAQMARQKPAVRKPDAIIEPAAPPMKKAPEPAPTVKKMPSSLTAGKEGTQTKKPVASSKPAVPPIKSKTNAQPVTKKIPKEVVVAMQVPLPPEEPHEVPLPAAEDDHDSVKGEAPKVSTTPEPSLDGTPRAPTAPKSTTPVSSPIPSKHELLVDFDQTVILTHRPTPPPTHGPASVVSSNLMDFDMSVVLPDNFAPLPATNASFPVLRDHQSTTPSTPVASKPSAVRTAKDPYETEGDSEARVALMEKELNTLRA